jgi:hypothetical protein
MAERAVVPCHVRRSLIDVLSTVCQMQVDNGEFRDDTPDFGVDSAEFRLRPQRFRTE